MILVIDHDIFINFTFPSNVLYKIWNMCEERI